MKAILSDPMKCCVKQEISVVPVSLLHQFYTKILSWQISFQLLESLQMS